MDGRKGSFYVCIWNWNIYKLWIMKIKLKRVCDGKWVYYYVLDFWLSLRVFDLLLLEVLMWVGDYVMRKFLLKFLDEIMDVFEIGNSKFEIK